MQKIKAYTLMEVTVAMLLSAICISVCYTAYTIIGRYYQNFQKKNETTAVVTSLKQVMERDFLKSTLITKSENGLQLTMDSLQIDYLFNEHTILRKLNNLHTDTFKLQAKEITVNFEGNSAGNESVVDEVSFNTILNREVKVPLQLKKLYSSANLFN